MSAPERPEDRRRALEDLLAVLQHALLGAPIELETAIEEEIERVKRELERLRE